MDLFEYYKVWLWSCFAKLLKYNLGILQIHIRWKQEFYKLGIFHWTNNATFCVYQRVGLSVEISILRHWLSFSLFFLFCFTPLFTTFFLLTPSFFSVEFPNTERAMARARRVCTQILQQPRWSIPRHRKATHQRSNAQQRLKEEEEEGGVCTGNGIVNEVRLEMGSTPWPHPCIACRSDNAAWRASSHSSILHLPRARSRSSRPPAFAYLSLWLCHHKSYITRCWSWLLPFLFSPLPQIQDSSTYPDTARSCWYRATQSRPFVHHRRLRIRRSHALEFYCQPNANLPLFRSLRWDPCRLFKMMRVWSDSTIISKDTQFYLFIHGCV